MKEGEQLKQFIDNQSKSKVSIAAEVGISKQTLFQYFKSSRLESETKKKFEDYFGKTIFTDSRDTVSTYPVRHSSDQEPLEKAILNMSEADKINAINIQRLIGILEAKMGINSPGPHNLDPNAVMEDLTKKKTGARASG